MDELKNTNQTEEEFLLNYKVGNYERPSVATDVVAFSVFSEEEDNYRKLPEQSLNVLLIKRGEHPYKGQWALPGGFVKSNETVDDTALRELKEETGVEAVYMEQLYTFSDVTRDPRTRVISASYMALLSHSAKVKGDTDAELAKWFKVSYEQGEVQKEVTEDGMSKQTTYLLTLTHEDERLEAKILCTQEVKHSRLTTDYTILESKGIAFDHSKIIVFAIERLRGKIDYTDIGFYLLSERFTLTGLQKVYEVVLGKTLTPANFRRKIMDKVIETDERAEGAGHRAAKLFKRNIELI